MSESGERFSVSEQNFDAMFFCATSLFSVAKLAKASNAFTLKTKTTSGGKLQTTPNKTKTAVNAGESLVGVDSNLPLEKHHFATNKNKLYTPKYEEILSKYGLGLDDGVNAPYGEWNKAMMPHKGRHPNEYHEFVLDQMMTASKEAGNSTELFIQKYNEYVVEPVMEHPEMLRKKYWRK